MTAIRHNIETVRRRIRAAAARAGRSPDAIGLVAVSKTVPVEKVGEAIDAGVDCLGENYIQEAREKIDALGSRRVAWHFIGHLQSNKAKFAVSYFDLIHSVDRVNLAREIDKQAARIGKIQPVLIQVNISEEATKSGIAAADTVELVRRIRTFAHVSIRGLMTMPPFFDDPEGARPFFRALSHLKDRIEAENIGGVAMDELSMGMTGDFETAIEEGATRVRVGSAIFGKRQ
ncbi:MAG: YggS family pyridoxal phosphate-dependent enzyme [Thermodesulfobacteriota bacterium]